MNDTEIDYSDCPPLGDEFFTKELVLLPQTQLTFKIDEDVLLWIQRQSNLSLSIKRILRNATHYSPYKIISH